MKTADIDKHLEDGTNEFAVAIGYTRQGTDLGDFRLEKFRVLRTGVDEHEQSRYRREVRGVGDISWLGPSRKTYASGILIERVNPNASREQCFVPAQRVYGTWDDHLVAKREIKEARQRAEDERQRITHVGKALAESTDLDPERYDEPFEALGRLIEKDPLDPVEEQPHVYRFEGYRYLHRLDEDLVEAIDEYRFRSGSATDAKCLYVHLHIKGALR